MTIEQKLLAVAAVIVGAVLLIPRAAQKVARGKRIGGADASVDGSGFVPGTPSVLAAQAGAGIDLYALARVIASEAGSLPEEVRVATAWAVRNEAARRNMTVSKLLLGTEARFGRQNAGKGRYASTAIAPTTGDLETARRVWSGLVPDPTGGATMWDSPNAQRALLARGTLGYKKTPEEVAVARVKQGYEVVHLPSVSPDKVRFWRKRGGGLFS